MALQHWRFSDLASWLPFDLRFLDAKPFINLAMAALRLCLHTCCRASQTRCPTSCKAMEEFHKRLKYFRLLFSMSFSCFSCPISITPSPNGPQCQVISLGAEPMRNHNDDIHQSKSAVLQTHRQNSARSIAFPTASACTA